MFCDASERAYTAVFYTRTVDELGFKSVHLLTSKTKVAPVKVISIPRLELCAAYLGSKLLETILTVFEVLDLEITNHAWTDSTIVLQWLAQLPKTWNTFIANRVSHIQEI